MRATTASGRGRSSPTTTVATRVFYTSTTQPDIGIGRVRVATPDDEDWIAWSKGAVVAEAPAELDIIAYRDPFVRAGARRVADVPRRPDSADGTATALSYRSGDLAGWEYEGIALQRSTNEVDPSGWARCGNARRSSRSTVDM